MICKRILSCQNAAACTSNSTCLLNALRRLNRAHQKLGSVLWSEEELAQYDSDKELMKKVYMDNRCHGFGVASDLAEEALIQEIIRSI